MSTLTEQRKPTNVQTLIFSKKVFKTAAAAKKWASDHDFKSSKVDTTGDSFRLRQREPGTFTEGSFRTISVTNGVKAVIGKLRESDARGECEIFDEHTLIEIIRKEGSKYVLRSKDGEKVLGRFDSKSEAETHEKRVKRFSKEGESMIGLGKTDNGNLVVVEGGRFKLTERETLPRLSDDELRSMRKTFIGERMKAQKKHAKMDDSAKFSTPQGQQAFADVEYYNGIVRQIEWEMSSRYLVL